ncbi:hypothetical protein ABZV58_23150 [Nocardia sp. NPDC004654]|uniref:hypothetical protein n=1 Tax=Nocardia sp. NPDC004654 TaxID=3154776 RepID=UPI0033AE8225
MTALVPRIVWGRIGSSSIRIAVVLVIAAAALWPAAAIIWIVRARVRFITRQALASLAATAAHRVEELRYLRSMLITALTTLAIVVSMSVINTGQHVCEGRGLLVVIAQQPHDGGRDGFSSFFLPSVMTTDVFTFHPRTRRPAR